MKHLRRLLPYAREHMGLIVAATACSILGQVAFILMPKVVEQIVTQVLQEGHKNRLAGFTALIFALAVIRGGLNYFEVILGARFGQAILKRVREEVYAHICRLSFSYFDSVRTGQLISRITSDLEPVNMFVTWGCRMIFKTAFTFIAVLSICFYMHARLTLVSLSVLPLLTLTAMYMGSRIRPAFERAREQLAVLTSALQENLQGIRLVKLYVREKAEIARFMHESELLRQKTFHAHQIDSVYYPVTGLFAGAAGLLVLWYGGLQVINGSLTLGQYVAFEAYLIYITLPMRMMGYMVSGMLRADASMQRVHAILDAVPEVIPPRRPVSMQRLEGEVIFDKVTFGYDANAPVLRDMSLELGAGRTIGILGPTGSGKSTLVSLIPRFYDPQRGRVVIDGHDVRQVDLASLRRQIGVVFQDTFLFSGTLRENIGFARPDASMDEIKMAARLVALDEFIAELPEKYETLIGERGVRLSGGQQQRVAIARALIANPRLLILDDCTSSVDTYTEFRIHSALKEYAQDITTIIIAQRASAVCTADRILVIEEGRIVETGTPAELVADPSTLYARLLDSQQSSFEIVPDLAESLAQSCDRVTT